MPGDSTRLLVSQAVYEHHMRLIVETHASYKAEREYILHILLHEFLGLDYTVRFVEREDVRISDGGTRELLVSDVLFRTPAERWLEPSSLPVHPCRTLDMTRFDLDAGTLHSTIPIIYGTPVSTNEYLRIEPERIEVGLDVLGSAFFMLSRYEEFVNSKRDKHGRFLASESVSFKSGFLERPIVNEYLEILWACMIRLWPQLRRKLHDYQLRLTHDIDAIACASGQPYASFIRACAGDLLRRRSLGLAARRVTARALYPWRGLDVDPCNTFDFIMDTSERAGLVSEFYFIWGEGSDVIRAHYDPQDEWLVALLKRITDRGHVIGLHPSYDTFRNQELFDCEVRVFRSACADIRVDQEAWGGRHHYLRFDAATTWSMWDRGGLNYDSSVAYAEEPGFRSGTCYEHSVFDLKTRKHLALYERPLIVMDTTLESYKRFSSRESLECIVRLATECRKYGGDFVTLWHNSKIMSRRQQKAYVDAIDAVR